jgi:hypothetical protein
MPLTDGQLREIGRIVTEFNMLENLMRYLVAGLISEDQAIGWTLIAGDTFAALHDKLRRLIPYRVKDPALRSRMAQHLKEAKQANDLRVEIVHSGWLSLDSWPEAIAFRVPKRGGYKVHQLDETKLMTIATAIRQVTKRLAETLPALHEAVPSLRKRYGSA